MEVVVMFKVRRILVIWTSVFAMTIVGLVLNPGDGGAFENCESWGCQDSDACRSVSQYCCSCVGGFPGHWGHCETCV